MLLFTNISHSQQFVIVDKENGDRLTGRFLNANDTHFEIEYNGQVLKFPLEGHTLSFVSKLENVPDKSAAKHYRNGLALLNLEAPELAKRKFEAALGEFPQFADAYYQLGLLYKTDGDVKKALAKLRSVAIIDAENFDLVPLLQEIGDNALAAEDYTHAATAFQIILKHYPKHESVPKLSYQTGFMLVEKLNDAPAALEVLQDIAIEFDTPEREKAVYLIGVLQADTGKIENALYTLRQFVRGHPNSEWVDDAHLKRAITYLQMGDRENAVKTANLVRKISKDPTIIAQADKVLRASAWNIYTDNLPDPNIQAIAIDGKSLWIGTPKGIAQIETGGNGGWRANEAAAWRINTGVSTVPDVRAIAVNASGVWVGTRNQGIVHYDKKRDEVKNYTIDNGFPSMWVRDIQMDNDEIWFATDAGVVRINPKNKTQHHYNQEKRDIPNNNIHSLALTPDTVWVGTSGSDINIFDRKSETEEWKPIRFTKVDPEIQIVRFDVIGNKTFFSWYNEDSKQNGYFESDWDGANAFSPVVSAGINEKTLLDDIFITGIVDKTIPKLPSENGESESIPIIRCLAVSDYVAINYPQTGEWDGTLGYPTIVLEDLTMQCIAIDNNWIWIGTSKGMLTIDKQKIARKIE